MIGQYKGFILENVAPKGVQTISIYDSNNVKKASMAVPSFMKYPSGDPLYSFGVLADIHIAPGTSSTTSSVEDFDFALNYLKNKGAVMACVCGDLTVSGFYTNSDLVLNTSQYAKFKEIKDKYNDNTFKVYAIAGNHENYFKPITEDMELYQSYVGYGLNYTILQDNDAFLFISQPAETKILNEDQLVWLQEQLEIYANKRCFVFIHPFINDSGNPLGIHPAGGNIYQTMVNYNSNLIGAFIEALKAHGNVTLFHGHSHYKFECQNDDKASNYSNKNGFHSVHVPSNAYPRIIEYVDGQPQRVELLSGSQFYYVEVFEDCIVLNGVDIGLENGERSPKLIPQGIIKIDTAQ